jgi:FixJ family two-component response regulator
MTRILRGSPWNLDSVSTWRDAIDYLERKPACVLICERELADGSWKDLLDHTASLQQRPAMIVASRSADNHLWAEVLNLGGSDVLAKPFETKEVIWSIDSAWHEWTKRCTAEAESEAVPTLA